MELGRPWPEDQEPPKWTVRGQAKRQKESLESTGPESRAGRFQEGGGCQEGLEVELVRVVRQGMR